MLFQVQSRFKDFWGPRHRGVHPLWDHDAFFPLFQISPLFSKKFRTLRKIFKTSWFSSAEISDDLFLVIDHKFRISPYFRCFSTFSKKYYFPCFAKIIISSLLLQISPLFYTNSPAFLHTLRVFRFPPTFTMMHLCITQCTYWTHLLERRACSASSTSDVLLVASSTAAKFHINQDYTHRCISYSYRV